MVESEVAPAPVRAGTLNHPSLKDTAAAYLREQILTGQLTPGTKVDQDEISVALGMSRLPVREALIELAQESLIDAVPRRGAFVARLERADIIDHYRIFGLIAGLAGAGPRTSLTDDAARAAAPHPRVVRRGDRPGGQGALEPRVPQDDQPGRWFAAVGRPCSDSCRAACRFATSSSSRTGPRSRPATTPASWPRSKRTTRTRRSGCWSTTSPRAATSRSRSSRRWATGIGTPADVVEASESGRGVAQWRRSTASACSSSATSWPGRTPGWCWPTSAPTCSRWRIPSHPDDARSMGPHFQGGQSLYFLALNSGKRSIGVRLATDEGRAVVEDLVRTADVVIDNYRPGVLAKFGLGPRRVARGQPRDRHVLAHRLRRDRAPTRCAPGTTTRSRRWPE